MGKALGPQDNEESSPSSHFTIQHASWQFNTGLLLIILYYGHSINILCPSIVSLFMSSYSLNKQAADQRHKGRRLNPPVPSMSETTGTLNRIIGDTGALWRFDLTHLDIQRVLWGLFRNKELCWEKGALSFSWRLAHRLNWRFMRTCPQAQW